MKGEFVTWEINPKHVYEVVYLYEGAVFKRERALIVRMSQGGYLITHDVQVSELTLVVEQTA